MQTASQKSDFLKRSSSGIFLIKKNDTKKTAARKVNIATKPYQGTNEVTLYGVISAKWLRSTRVFPK